MTTNRAASFSLVCLCFLSGVLPGLASNNAHASALSDAAAQLQPGQWVVLSTNNFNGALLDDGAGYNVFYYTEDMSWDPVSRQLLFVGGGHDTDAEFLRYSEATNTWQRSKPGGGSWHSNFSHAYDHNAIMPALGKFFTRQPAYDPSDRVEIYDIASSTWARSAPMPYKPGCCGGLEFFPELNGLVHVDGYHGVLLYEPTPNRWTTLSGTGWGEYHNFAEYSPVHKVLIYGGSETSGGQSVFRLNASRQVTRLRDAPQRLGTTHSLVTADPSRGNFLVFFDGAFYEFNPVTDTWRQMPTNAPWSGGVFGTVATPISTYGVNLFARYTGGSSARIYLYKHSADTGTPVPTVNLTANPTSIPSGGMTTLDWSSSGAASCAASGGWTGAKATSGSESRGPLSATTTFTLSCVNAQGGSASKSATVTVASSTPAPTVNFTATPTSVAPGGSSMLGWTTSGATSCTGTGGLAGWAGAKSVPNGSQNVGPFDAAATFGLSCTGAGGTTQRNVTVSVQALPTLTFSGNPTSIASGGSSTLTWSSTNATTCSASGGWSGSKAVSGSQAISNITATTTYSLVCAGVSGSSPTRSATVTVTGSPPPPPPPTGSDITSLTVVSSSGSAQTNVPVTFGQVFKPGDIPAGAVMGARVGTTVVPLQVDKKATHPDGSLRHAVLTAMMPSLGANGTATLTLNNSGSVPSGGPITTATLLATSFDATINLNIGGTAYSASARSLLQAGTPGAWLSGPLATEWILSGPVRTSAGVAHPHLQARFNVRAFQGLRTVRVEAVLENNWAYETGPRNYTYNVAINVAGGGAQYSQNNVNHYRQSRWRRIVWWGTNPQLAVRHDSAYLQATRAVPTYDPRVTISSSAISNWQSGLGTNPGVMSIGALEPNMPQPAGRLEIAPLPAFQAGYVISQEDTARRVTIGYGEQAGAWPMHYRDKNTDQPISIDRFPNASIIGGSGIFGNFPACGGTCSTNLVPEASHHPTLAYLPYLITGDYYLMEETVFWGNWVLFFGEASRHGGSQGLVVWDQVRGQAWMMRTLAESAYATPDNHPMKAYLNQKLQNNITYFRNNWVDSNPLGYITNTGAANWLGYPGILSTWMDDFLTWTFGHMVGMGFSEAQPVLAWKAKFAVGRLSDPGMCWKLASTNWVYATHKGYGGDSNNGTFITNWTDWRRNVVYGWDESLRGTNNIAGKESALFSTQCASLQMNSILGIGAGEMIGWDGTEAYPANIQAAAAVAVEAGVPNAQQAFNTLTSRGSYPLSAYGSSPQWALYPAATGAGGGPGRPTVQLSVNPTSVPSGQTSTLTWSSSNATSCTASGGWTGNKALSGSQATPAITANTTFLLTCTNAAGSTSASTTVTVQSTPPPTAPTLTLSANPTAVVSGGSSTLTWSSTNATSCTASGGWTGTKATSGSQTISNITQTSSYSLVCSGPGGNTPTRSTTVTVQANPAPTLTFSGEPLSVTPGGSSQLTWSSTNATSCTASNGWSGAKATSGTQTVSNLTSTTTYSLVCTGAGGNSPTRSVTITVTGGGGGTAALQGTVDSSYVDRLVNGDNNRVYVFSGTVTPDDIDGDAVDPIATVPVTQDANACTFSYADANFTPGTYTIAFTKNAAADLPGANNPLTFVGARQVTIGSAPVVANFRPSNILRVGPGRQFTTLRAANLAATDGAVIEMDAGAYTDDVTVWRQNRVTLRGVGGRAHLRGTQVIPFVSGDDRRNGMGLLVTRGTGISIENIEFSGARVTDLNGAGIRNQGRDLAICNGNFHDNQDGFLGGAYGTLLIEYTEFARNGLGDPGHNHNIYVDDGSATGDRLIFRHNYSHHAFIGHLLKTRARENYIYFNRLMDERDGSSSYNIDVPNGGLTFVIGNLLQQGPQTDNSSMVNYGTEGLSGGRTHELYLVNNTWVNDAGFGGFLQFQGGTALVRTINNLFTGNGSQPSGSVVQATTNLLTSNPGLVNRTGFDYRLTSSSPAHDAGAAPGSARNVNMLPGFQYVHPAQRQPRPGDARIDIGAYEYAP